MHRFSFPKFPNFAPILVAYNSKSGIVIRANGRVPRESVTTACELSDETLIATGRSRAFTVDSVCYKYNGRGDSVCPSLSLGGAIASGLKKSHTN